MAIGSISIQSNISLILVFIILVLVFIYFYLDMRKLKLQISNLEKNNENFIKEFDNINKGLSILFSKNTVDSNTEPPKIDKKSTTVSHEEVVEETDKKENIDDSKDISENNIEESIQNNIEEMVMNTGMNNIFGVMSANIIMEDNINITDNLSDEVNDIEEIIDDDDIEELNEEEVEGLDDDVEGLDDDGVEGLDDDVEGLDDIILNDDNSKYFTMSVKELKEKCIEMGLKHSGNKNTLAQRIVDNLK